jgi:hypothetical protein
MGFLPNYQLMEKTAAGRLAAEVAEAYTLAASEKGLARELLE